MSINAISRLLPYALLTFVGVAGWTMESTALLIMVVFGTAGVAIGQAIAARPILPVKEGAEASPLVKNALGETRRID